MTKVYNLNAAVINQTCRSHVKRVTEEGKKGGAVVYPRLQPLAKDDPEMSDGSDFDEALAVQKANLNRIAEATNVAQVAEFYSDFPEKVQKVIERALTLDLPVTPPKMAEIDKESRHRITMFSATLRVPRNVVLPTSASSTLTPIPSISSNSSTRLTTEQVVEVSLPSKPLALLLTVPYSLEEGQALGICHEPKWQQDPVLFIATAQGWQGEVPYGKEFKYVIVKGVEIVKWENGENRSVSPDHSLPSGTDSPNF